MHITVMLNESYAISTSISSGETPASANARGPDCAPALTVMSPPFSRYFVASPAPIIHAGFLRQFAATSGDAIITAPPPSEIMQHSSRCNGCAITRESSTS